MTGQTFAPPSPWLRNSYVQTILPFLVKRAPRLCLDRERWELPDGDFLDVDICRPPADAGPPRGFAILLHGLEGSSRARYMLGTMELCPARRILAIAVNFRTCSGVPNRLPRAYHCGDSEDLGHVVAEVRRRFPGLPGAIVGYSAGGNVALKWLAEERGRVPAEIRGAAVASVPFSLRAVAEHNDRAPHFLIREFFLRTLRPKALAKAVRFPGLLDPAAVRASTTFRAFDHSVTAHLHGFRDAGEYWRRCSSRDLVGAIDVPCLVLGAADDPIVPASVIPVDEIRRNRHLNLEITPHGGHVGWVGGSPLAPRFWAEERAISFVDDLLSREPRS